MIEARYQAKRCADILQSLVEEVEANIASTIYREEPLQPLAMPADMDKSLRAAAGYCIALGEIGQVLENISHGKTSIFKLSLHQGSMRAG